MREARGERSGEEKGEERGERRQESTLMVSSRADLAAFAKSVVQFASPARGEMGGEERRGEERRGEEKGRRREERTLTPSPPSRYCGVREIGGAIRVPGARVHRGRQGVRIPSLPDSRSLPLILDPRSLPMQHGPKP